MHSKIPWIGIYMHVIQSVGGVWNSALTTDGIVESLRAGMVLPASQLSRHVAEVCDSLSSGPFCGLVNSKPRAVPEGLINSELWGGIPEDSFFSIFGKLSEYAQNHWLGSIVRNTRKLTVAALDLTFADNHVHFSPPLACDSHGFTSTSPSVPLALNSYYAYISFPSQSVSVIDLTVRASASSHVLVRAYNDGVPMWTRLVFASQEVNVATRSPHGNDDPSIQAVNHIEFIGLSASVLALSVSFSEDPKAASGTYVYIEKDLESNIRQFPPSAYIIDMQSAVEQGMTWVNDVPTPIVDVRSMFTIESFTNSIARTSVDERFVSSFIRSLETYIGNPTKVGGRNFETIFTDVLLDSSPELLAAMLAVTDTQPNNDGVVEYGNILSQVKARIEGAPFTLTVVAQPVLDPEESAQPLQPSNVSEGLPASVVTEDGPSPPASAVDVDFNSSMSDSPLSPELIESVNKIIPAILSFLGETKFNNILSERRFERIDEKALLALLVNALELPISESTSVEVKRTILSHVLAALASQDNAANFNELAEILAQTFI